MSVEDELSKKLAKSNLGSGSEFFLSILFHLIFPLMPLGLQWWFSGAVDKSSLSIACSMYAISIGISSVYRLNFGICILVCVIFASGYGAESVGSRSVTHLEIASSFAMVVLFVLHCVERYQRHWKGSEKYWAFEK